VANQTPSSPTPVTQTSDVHNVKKKNPKGKQQTEGKKKHKIKKGKGDKKDENSVGKGKTKKRKVKFLCKICMENHLTHQCPQLEEVHKLLSQQQLAMLTNPFP
jgi:hypothetical protein